MKGPIEKSLLEKELVKRFPEFESRLNGEGGGSLQELRTEALNVLAKTGFPTIRLEDWRYTDLHPALNEEWQILPQEVSVSLDQIKSILPNNLDTYRIVLVNGIYNASLSLPPQEQEGIIVSSLNHAIRKHRALVEAHLGRYVSLEFNGFVAANAAYARNGLFVHVSKGQKLDKPVHLISLSGEGKPFVQLRSLIVAEEQSEVTVIESTASLGEGASLTNIVTEISAERGARVNHYKLQQENNAAVQANLTQMRLKDESRCQSFTITLGGGMVRNDLNFSLGGQNSESHLYGLYITSAKQHFDNHTFVDHAMPRCFSNEFYKGIMMDRSTAVFNGKILVQPDAQKTNAYQSNKNVLLSEEARINTKPQLEIFADDVKCSHGATTGQLDEEALFYMRSRGISEQEAKALLTYAFAADVLEHVAIEPLKLYLEAAVHAKLGR